MLMMDVGVDEFDRLDALARERPHQVVEQPVFANNVAVERVRDHRRMARQDLGRDVVVAVNAMRRRVELAGVAVG